MLCQRMFNSFVDSHSKFPLCSLSKMLEPNGLDPNTSSYVNLRSDIFEKYQQRSLLTPFERRGPCERRTMWDQCTHASLASSNGNGYPDSGRYRLEQQRFLL